MKRLISPLRLLTAAALALCANAAIANAGLTPTETKWIRGATAVLNYAHDLRLPVDIVVQPQAGPQDVPMAMGYHNGRCKLVLSMRGNPKAETQLAGVPAELQALMIETMAAHEIAHCWRHAKGAWQTVPAGLEESEPVVGAKSLAQHWQIRAARREEAFSDLVALAWVKHRHPAHYETVYNWLEGTRAAAGPAGHTHDTSAWVRLARDMRAFDAADTPFDAAAGLWSRGLRNDR